MIDEDVHLRPEMLEIDLIDHSLAGCVAGGSTPRKIDITCDPLWKLHRPGPSPRQTTR